jgi:hypothetical protein
LIFGQCFERALPAEDSGSTSLLDAVKVYHRILPEEEAEYQGALLAAYREFCQARKML